MIASRTKNNIDALSRNGRQIFSPYFGSVDSTKSLTELHVVYGPLSTLPSSGISRAITIFHTVSPVEIINYTHSKRTRISVLFKGCGQVEVEPKLMGLKTQFTILLHFRQPYLYIPASHSE